MENQKENQKEKIIDKNKSLEQILIENNYKINPVKLSNMVKKIMVINNYESETTAREILKQRILNGEKLEKYFEDKQVELQENYNNKVLQNLERLMTAEKESYNKLMDTFKKEEELEKNTKLKEKVKLQFYKVSGNTEKLVEFSETLKDELRLRSFDKVKQGLAERLDYAKNLKEKNTKLIEKGRTLIDSSTNNLRAILNTLKAGKNSVTKLKQEKQRIQDDLNKEESYSTVYDEKRDQINKLSRDINCLHEEGMLSLEDAEDLESEVVDYTKDVNERTYLKNFYKDLARIYTRRIRIISKIMIKINQGLSFKVAYEEARIFAENDKAFNEYEKIKKDQYAKKNNELLSFKFPHRENELQAIDHSKKDLDYSVLISEGINKIDSFLSKVPDSYNKV